MLWIAEVAKRESVSAIQPSKVSSSAFGAGSDVNHGDLHASSYFLCAKYGYLRHEDNFRFCGYRIACL